MSSRRRLLKIMTGVSAILLTGCAAAPAIRADRSRTYCLKTLKRKRTMCTAERTPSIAVEAEAKRFEPMPDVLTLFVVRWSWVDAVKPIPLVIDDDTQIVTLPKSLVRIRLAPGPHELSFEWDGKVRRHAIEARAGEVKFVDLAGSAMPWDLSFYWSDIDPEGAKLRARRSRLIADV